MLSRGASGVIFLLQLHFGCLLRKGRRGLESCCHDIQCMFFSEKKKHRQPRSLSFGNCGWEGPLWLVRQSGQSDSPFPESQAGTRRLKEERHQAELDCLLLWTVRQGGRLNCFAAVHFFPFSLPCLLSLLPADSGGSPCSSPWKPPQLEGRVSEVCGLTFISLFTLSSSPEEMGTERKVLREKML